MNDKKIKDEELKVLEGKNVLLGVTGGIAAYKAANIISILKKYGANVNVIMTKSATEIITPLTLRTLSKNPVVTEMFKDTDCFDVKHISLAQSSDIVIIAPATANIIGKIANGIADDMLSTTVMATSAKVLIAPAMNTIMYKNPIVQKNIESLKNYGYKLINPKKGMLACGYEGEGKMEDPIVIVNEIAKALEGGENE